MNRPWHPRLPVAGLRGRFLLAESALAAAEQLLPTYRGIDGAHEGIVFLGGRETPDVTLLTTAIAPNGDHGRGHLACDVQQVNAVVDAAHELGIGVLAQVHSHPGDLTEHSRGDDTMVLMPFEGMLSLVVPCYGRYGMRPLEMLGVHQYQDGGWIVVEPGSVRAGMTVVPGGIDLR